MFRADTKRVENLIQLCKTLFLTKATALDWPRRGDVFFFLFFFLPSYSHISLVTFLPQTAS